MFGYLILLFTLVPAIELYVLIEVGSVIGAGNTILIIILTGVVGATLARIQGFIVLQEIQNNLNKGLMPNSQLMDGLMILVGGIVLLTPGFITDFLGFIFLIPFTRAIIKLWLTRRFERAMREGQTVHFTSIHQNQKPPGGRYDDIDI